MTFQRRRMIIAGGLFAVMIGLITGMYWIAAHVTRPDSAAVVIAQFEDDLGRIENLPHSALLDDQPIVFSGRLHFAVPGSMRTPYVYIPKYEGELTIKIGNRQVFHGRSPALLGRSGAALFSVPNDLREATFTLAPTEKRFILISKVFIGEKDLFWDQYRFLNSASLIGGILLFGITLATVFRLLALAVTRHFFADTAPALVVSIYVLLLSLNAVGDLVPYYGSVVRHICLMFPLLLGNLWLVGEKLRGGNKGSLFPVVQITAFSLGLVFVFADHVTSGVDIGILSAVLAVIGLVYIGLENLAYGMRRSNIHAGGLGIGLLTCSAIIFHDATIRLGYFQQDLYIAAFGKVIFVLMAATSFWQGAKRVSRDLGDHDDRLIQALTQQGQQLTRQFQTESALVFDNARAQEKTWFQKELHDGVMSHLSVIHALTEDETEGDGAVINGSSRAASQEIRMMFDRDSDNKILIKRAMLNFQQHVLDRLASLGVDVQVETAQLAQLEPLDFKLVVEVMRILQEAVHNAVMRNRCTRLILTAQVGAKSTSQTVPVVTLRLILAGGTDLMPGQDDKSWNNILLRAKNIGADFQIQAIATGTDVTLTLINPR